MKTFIKWLDENGFAYYLTKGEGYVEFLINKCNGIVVRWYNGTRCPYVKQADNSWTRYGAKQLKTELANLND